MELFWVFGGDCCSDCCLVGNIGADVLEGLADSGGEGGTGRESGFYSEGGRDWFAGGYFGYGVE